MIRQKNNILIAENNKYKEKYGISVNNFYVKYVCFQIHEQGIILNSCYFELQDSNQNSAVFLEFLHNYIYALIVKNYKIMWSFYNYKQSNFLYTFIW